jgi:hypothetical protein
MQIYESIFFILLITLISILLISYFNDYYFCIMSILYQMNFIKLFNFDYFDLLIVFSFICFCVTIFTNLKYFNKFDVNINFNKNDDENFEEEIDIKNLYNKNYKQNFYDSI